MKILVTLIVLSVISLFTQSKFESERLSFELRLAFQENGPGLTEMTFYRSGQKFYLEDSVYLSNHDLKSAKELESEGLTQIYVKLTDEGKRKFSQFTLRNIHCNAAMIVDGLLVSAPVIRAQINSGELIIMGYFSEEEADRIAKGIIWR